MAACCDCNGTLSNTGTPSCQPIMGVGVKLILVNLIANDGTKNVIDISTYTGSQAEWDARLNDTDGSKRYYPLPAFKNVEDVKGDTIFETFNDTSNLLVQEGTRTYTGVMPNESPTLLGKMKEARCQKIGVYIVDDCGNLIGNISSDGASLDPIPVDNNTWNPILVKATDTTVQKIQLSFEYSRLTKDEDLKMIAESESEIDLLTLRGLLDVNAAISNETTGDPSSFTSTMALDYGTAKNPIKVEGLVQADFSLFNETDSVAVTINGVVESSAGVYDFDIADSSGDTLTLSLSKDGLEMPDTTVVIP